MLKMSEAQLCLPQIFWGSFRCELAFRLSPKNCVDSKNWHAGTMQNNVYSCNTAA